MRPSHEAHKMKKLRRHRMGKIRNAQGILIEKSKRGRLGRSWHRWRVNVKTDIKKRGCKDVNWIQPSPDRDQRLGIVKTIIPFQFDAKNMLITWCIITFSRRTLFHQVSWCLSVFASFILKLHNRLLYNWALYVKILIGWISFDIHR
jgi:hypothetical protein